MEGSTSYRVENLPPSRPAINLSGCLPVRVSWLFMRIRRCCVYTAEAARHPVLFLVWSAPMLPVRLDWKQNIISLQLWDDHKTRHSTLRGRAGFATLVLVQHPAVRCTASELEVFKLRQTEREKTAVGIHAALSHSTLHPQAHTSHALLHRPPTHRLSGQLCPQVLRSPLLHCTHTQLILLIQKWI